MSTRTKVGIKLLLLLAGIGVAVYCFLHTIGWFWNPSLLESRTEAFLGHVSEQNFEEAVKEFDDSTANPDWPNDMRKLHEEHEFKLLAFRKIKAEYDDGSYNTGHGELTFEIDKTPLKTEVILTFGIGGLPKQICVINPSPSNSGQDVSPALTEWNRLMCGASF